jgi:hypothetical protein
VYVLGRSPGSGGSTDFAILKYDRAGAPVWDVRFSRAAGAYGWPFELERGLAGDIFAAGWSFGQGTGADFTVVKHSEPVASAIELAPPLDGTSRLWIRSQPNPSVGTTSILYRLAEPGPVRVAVYAASGRVVRTLLSGIQPAGSYRLRWDGADGAGRPAPAGVYWCLVQAGRSGRAAERLTLLR